MVATTTIAASLALTGTSRPQARKEGEAAGARAPNFDCGGEMPQLWSGLNVAYTTKFLESFHPPPPTGVRMHRIRFMSGLCPRTLLGAHSFKITPMHCDLLTSEHLTSEAYFIMLTCSPSFTLAALGHTSFNVYTMY